MLRMQKQTLLYSWQYEANKQAKENLLSLSRTKDLLMTINNYSQTL
jgi:hypothetical protein